MNRINESNRCFESMNRIKRLNQWTKSMIRNNESNQWIELRQLSNFLTLIRQFPLENECRANRAKRGERGTPPLHIQRSKTESRTMNRINEPNQWIEANTLTPVLGFFAGMCFKSLICSLFFLITRHHELGFGRNLAGMLPTSLPELPIQLRDLRNNQKS